jgi:formylglycine-generating enzyme required for sulfatase activity
VVKGGDWASDPKGVRVSGRSAYHDPDTIGPNIGVRCAASALAAK